MLGARKKTEHQAEIPQPEKMTGNGSLNNEKQKTEGENR